VGGLWRRDDRNGCRLRLGGRRSSELGELVLERREPPSEVVKPVREISHPSAPSDIASLLLIAKLL
jgi:hypothetical protein